MTPEENFQFINEFLSRMTPAITDASGFIDKFIGEGGLVSLSLLLSVPFFWCYVLVLVVVVVCACL